MTQKTKTTSLIDYMKAGAEIKLIEALLWELEGKAYKILDGREVNGAGKTIYRVLTHIKSDAEDNMFEAYPDLGQDYIHVFYSSLYCRLSNDSYDDVEKEIRSIALDLIADIVTNMYGDQVFDMMKQRWERNHSFEFMELELKNED